MRLVLDNAERWGQLGDYEMNGGCDKLTSIAKLNVLMDFLCLSVYLCITIMAATANGVLATIAMLLLRLFSHCSGW